MREWIKVKHTATSMNVASTTVTCTVVDGDLSASWSEKTYTSTIPAATRQARAKAREALSLLQSEVSTGDGREAS